MSKKIMFNDLYGLTQAVLDGRKTMTRREPFFGTISKPNYGFYTEGADKGKLALCDGERIVHKSHYRMNEIVAVAQAYKNAWVEWQNLWEKSNDPNNWRTPDAMLGDQADTTRGWSNKMFVRADLMPHQIRITNVKVERLQDCSDDDILKEGIYKDVENGFVVNGYFDKSFKMPFFYTFYGAIGKETGGQLHWTTPREAFSVLIDKVSGKGTWESNPWVFAYEFELVN